MIYRFVLLALFFALGAESCTHVGRAPAAQPKPTRPPPKTCGEIFERTFDAANLDHAYEVDRYVYNQIRDYVENHYEDWLEDFMAKARQNHGDCEVSRDVDLYAADIALKSARFTARLKQGEAQTAPRAILSNPLFADPRTGAVLACYAECTTRQGSSCQKNCLTNSAVTRFFDESAALKAIARLCFATADAPAAREEFATQYAKLVPPYVERLANAQSAFRDELATDRKIVENLQRLRSSFDKFRAETSRNRCGPPSYPWAQAVRAASVNLLTEQDPNPQAAWRDQTQGSGFYVPAPRGRYLVTAAHVSEPNINVSTVTRALMAVLKPGGRGEGELLEFEITPGLLDLGRDISLAKQEKPGPVLILARDDDVPERGQRFYLTGYPGSQGDKFTILRCTFLGFGPRLQDGSQTSLSYFMNCPGAPDLHGISGGAALDRDGRAWGVNVTSIPAMSIVVVAPLSRAANGGGPKMGIQKIFVSDFCYAPLTYEPHRCQVLPDLQGKDVP